MCQTTKSGWAGEPPFAARLTNGRLGTFVIISHKGREPDFRRALDRGLLRGTRRAFAAAAPTAALAKAASRWWPTSHGRNGPFCRWHKPNAKTAFKRTVCDEKVGLRPFGNAKSGKVHRFIPRSAPEQRLHDRLGLILIWLMEPKCAQFSIFSSADAQQHELRSVLT